MEKEDVGDLEENGGGEKGREEEESEKEKEINAFQIPSSLKGGNGTKLEFPKKWKSSLENKLTSFSGRQFRLLEPSLTLRCSVCVNLCPFYQLLMDSFSSSSLSKKFPFA